MADKIILHCDLNNFYASVECELNPEYKGQALAVSGNPEKRHGVVLAKNEIAKKFGIKTGDTIWEAKLKCPDITFVPPHFELYTKYSKQVFDIYSTYTCYVEPFGPDECWLDVTGSTKLFGSGFEIAEKIRKRVKEETGLSISVGVSFNKVFAKMASDMKKPDATTVISRENFKEKIWKLPASDMLMVGRKTAEKLAKLNIHTVGDLANADENLLTYQFGINGKKMKENANGENTESVREYVKSREIESVGHGMTATRDIKNYDDLYSMLCYLADLVATRMRKYNVKGYGVHIDLRSFELKHQSKQRKLLTPTQTAIDIANEAFSLAKEIWQCTPPLRTVTVSVFDLIPSDSAQQLSMFEVQDKKAENIELAMDKIRKKYGKDKIFRANTFGKDFIYDKNDDEDFLPFKR